MSESYNLKSSFGFNVQPRGTQTSNAQSAESISNQAVKDIFGVNKYLTDNEDVFNGNVEHQIDLYTRQSMIIGMNLRNAQGPKRKLDVSL